MSTVGHDHVQLALKKEKAQEKTQPQIETVIKDNGYIVIADKWGGFSIQRAKKCFLGNLQ